MWENSSFYNFGNKTLVLEFFTWTLGRLRFTTTPPGDDQSRSIKFCPSRQFPKTIHKNKILGKKRCPTEQRSITPILQDLDPRCTCEHAKRNVQRSAQNVEPVHSYLLCALALELSFQMCRISLTQSWSLYLKRMFRRLPFHSRLTSNISLPLYIFLFNCLIFG